MSSGTDVWMPLYFSDYLRDTLHLSAEEHGAYVLLLIHAWINGGELPDDDERLRRISRMTDKSWRASRAEIRSFFIAEDGVLRHKRVAQELAKARANIEQKKAAGKASAEARKKKRNSLQINEGSSTAVETSVATESQRLGNPSPSPSLKPTTTTNSRESSTYPLCAETEAGPSPGDGSHQATPDVPTNEGQWMSWFNANYGQSYNPTSRFDRKKLWPIFRRWCDARVSTAKMADVIRKAQAEAKAPIANIPEYADRVLASMQARDAPSSRPKPFDPFEFVNNPTGNSHDLTTPVTIDGSAIRVA